MNYSAMLLEEHKDTFNRLTEFMLQYNEKVNLTRIIKPCEIYEKHYLDSILPLEYIEVPRGTSILDVGTGGGFPGVPIKIVRSDLNVVLLDSLKKRIEYLNLLATHLDIPITAIHGRGEELSHDKKHREKYDIGISRAVANLSSLSEYVLPFIKVGGMFLAMKGEKNELDNAQNSIKLLGGEVSNVIEYTLPSSDKRTLIVIKKISHTTTNLPRKRINITKNPL